MVYQFYRFLSVNVHADGLFAIAIVGSSFYRRSHIPEEESAVLLSMSLSLAMFSAARCIALFVLVKYFCLAFQFVPLLVSSALLFVCVISCSASALCHIIFSFVLV